MYGFGDNVPFIFIDSFVDVSVGLVLGGELGGLEIFAIVTHWFIISVSPIVVLIGENVVLESTGCVKVAILFC